MGWLKPGNGVVSYTDVSEFPVTGDPSTIYISTDTTTLYLWNQTLGIYESLPIGALIASAVVNDSSVIGATVKDALNTLLTDIGNIPAGLTWKGTWDASLNLPVISSGVGTNGWYYQVTVAGNTNIDGITDWAVNDWIIFNGSVWQKIDNSQTPVTSNDVENLSSVDGTNSTEALNNLLVAQESAFSEQDIFDRYWIEEGYHGRPLKILPLSASRAYYTYVIQNDTAIFSSDGITFYKYLATFGTGSPSGSMAFSNDGINWVNEVAQSGLTGYGYHSVMIYDGTHVLMWYWTGTMDYTMGNVHFAKSLPGSANQFFYDVALTEVTPGQVISGYSGTDYRRGSYGSSQMFFNPSATNTGTYPLDYSYYGILGTTNGATETSVWVYSADGIAFTRWDGNGDVGIIIPKADSFYQYSAHQLVYLFDPEWKVWVCYFTGSPSSPNNQNVGFGYSVNILDVPTVIDAPFYPKRADLVEYGGRSYCPAFATSPSGELIMYKTGRSIAGVYGTYASVESMSKYAKPEDYRRPDDYKDLIPKTDNVFDVGSGVNRWHEIFAGNNVINTSDEREKANFRALTEVEITASREIINEIGIFQFIAAISLKGEEDARWHTGLKAQKIVEILENNGLDPYKYGFICLDTWERVEIQHDAIEAIPEHWAKNNVVLYTEPGDTSSYIYCPAVSAQDAWVEVIEAGNRYSLRYSQLTLFLLVSINQRLSSLEI